MWITPCPPGKTLPCGKLSSDNCMYIRNPNLYQEKIFCFCNRLLFYQIDGAVCTYCCCSPSDFVALWCHVGSGETTRTAERRLGRDALRQAAQGESGRAAGGAG